MQEKRCPHCDTIKSVALFGKKHATLDGLSCWCLLCKSSEERKRVLRDPLRKKSVDADYRNRHRSALNAKHRLRYQYNKTRQRDLQLKKAYGIGVDEYDAMLSRQGGVCACCGTTYAGAHFLNMMVDHCHVTGMVRGLLCFKCNSILGFCKESEVHLRLLIDYIKRHDY